MGEGEEGVDEAQSACYVYLPVLDVHTVHVSMAHCAAPLQSVCTDLRNRETSLKEAAVELLHKARKETKVKEPDELPLELKQVRHSLL